MANNYYETSGAFISCSLNSEQRAHLDEINMYLALISQTDEQIVLIEGELNEDMDETLYEVVDNLLGYAKSQSEEHFDALKSIIYSSEGCLCYYSSGSEIELRDRGVLLSPQEQPYSPELTIALIQYCLILKDAPEQEAIFFADHYYCDKLRLDEFGGAVMLITQDDVNSVNFSTDEYTYPTSSLNAINQLELLHPVQTDPIQQDPRFFDGDSDLSSEHKGSYMVPASKQARLYLSILTDWINAVAQHHAPSSSHNAVFTSTDLARYTNDRTITRPVAALIINDMRMLLRCAHVSPDLFDSFLLSSIQLAHETNQDLELALFDEKPIEPDAIWFAGDDDNTLMVKLKLFAGHLLLLLDNNDTIINPGFSGTYDEVSPASGLISRRGVSFVDQGDAYSYLRKKHESRLHIDDAASVARPASP